jgi:hypothetical protein
MKTKFLVIPVNLGFDVDDIITTDLTELTSESRSELNKAINIAKAAQNLLTEKTKAKEEKTSRLQQDIVKIYDSIISNGNTGTTSKEIRNLIGQEVNMSTLTAKLKLHIKGQNEKLELEKVTRAGVVYYRITEVN